jgi:putative transposase
LVRAYDVLCLEEVQARNLVRNHHLAKSIADVGWAAFRVILACKAAWAGKRVVAVAAQVHQPGRDRRVAAGSRCVQRVVKSVSVRTHVCPSCGLVIARDEDAARSILRAGQARQGAVAVAAVVN